MEQKNVHRAIWGCVLIGGQSSRMGHPKHLIHSRRRTWLERIVAVLARKTTRVVLAGGGEIPLSLAHLTRVPDPDGLAGPLAGILSVERRFPEVSWLLVACDQPWVSEQALQWLLDQRRPGCVAVLPDVRGKGRVEPLLAYYDRDSRAPLESLAASKRLRISLLQGEPGVLSPQPPEFLHPAWRNINTPEELIAWLKEDNPSASPANLVVTR